MFSSDGFTHLPAETFAATGWRVGYLIGPQSILKPTVSTSPTKSVYHLLNHLKLAATTRIVFCSNSPMQEAVAGGLELAPKYDFYTTQLREYTARRNILVKAFDDLGLKYSLPEGSYFILLVSANEEERNGLC